MTLSESFQQWYAIGSTFQYKNHDENHAIFYKNEGVGDAMLCLHGFPTASWDWYRVWDDLTARCQVIATDMLGFGYSDKPRRHTYSILEQADIHEALLQHLGIKRVHIFAHDYGDTVAQELIARHNDGKLSFEILSVCLLNGGLFPETHHPRPIQKLLLTPVLGTIIARFFNRKAFARIFIPIFGANTKPTEGELDEFWQLIDQHNGRVIINKLLHYMPERVTHRERWVAALQKATCPLMLIDGIDDPVSGGHMADRYIELIPHPNVTRLEGIGHYPQVEAPQRVLAAYLEFLEPLLKSD
ncbi:MAG: alpha/beta hydrolase [Anaerolineae bacterium]|nr:alpha/beta hydrolase [Anaerolineae bacterium]